MVQAYTVLSIHGPTLYLSAVTKLVKKSKFHVFFCLNHTEQQASSNFLS